MRVAILTVSDSVAKAERDDSSGGAIREWCVARGYEVSAQQTVGDETSVIAPVLIEWCDAGAADLVLTTGGTGLSQRDVTPEATRAVIEREAQGIAEFVRASSFVNFPRAALSRGVAGVRASTLIINLPGSPAGVRDALTALEAIVDHGVDVLSGRVTRHDAMQGSGAV